MSEVEVYIDESNKVIFDDLNKHLGELKNSVIKQNKRKEFCIQRELSIYKETIDERLLEYNVIYRLVVSRKYTKWEFYLKDYKEVKEKIISVLKDGLFLFDEKVYNFDNFKIEILRVERFNKKFKKVDLKRKK